jgi:hypothetical protein
VRFRLYHPNAAAGLAAVATACAVGAGALPASAGPASLPSREAAVAVASATPAGTFGAALAKQFASDRARGRYGTDGMFAGGVRISLAGARPALAPRQDSPMHTLTVRGIDAAGQPANGGGVIVANVNHAEAFGEGFNALRAFRNGVATFRVPAGTYWAVGVFDAGAVTWGGGPDDTARASGAARMVVLPQFAVPDDKTITVDARKAVSRLRLSTPLPATPQFAQINAERISHGGQTFLVSVTAQNSAGGFYVSPVSHKPVDGTLDSTTGAQLFSPASAATPYQYYVIVKSPSGTIAPQNFRVSARSLATVHENLYAGAPSTSSLVAFGHVPSEIGEPLIFVGLPALSSPGRDTVYLSAAGGSATWTSFYHQLRRGPSGGQSGTAVRYRPGQVTTENWNAYPLHTAPNVNLLGAANRPAIVSANRSGDILTLNFTPFSDSVNGHLGTGYDPVSGGAVSGTYQIKQNGTTIASGSALNSPGTLPGEFYHRVTLSPRPAMISFTLTAKRTGAAFTLSTATKTTWTWRSAHESGATVPSWWYCSFARNHNCAAQALPILNYAVGGLALNGTTAPGAQSLAVTVGHLQLAPAQKITKVTVQASFNGGKTWTSAAVTGSGGRYHARFTAPARSYVTLRVTATSAIGAQVSETITRAYAIAS